MNRCVARLGRMGLTSVILSAGIHITQREVLGQQTPWLVFDDPQSATVCEVVNADNATLVLLADTRNLNIVSGADIALLETFVDDDGNVLFAGEPAGILEFYLSGDGRRSVWWTALTGEVVRINGFTGQPTVTEKRPIEYRDVGCDACEFWDIPQDCAEPPTTPPPTTVRFCGQDIAVPIAMIALMTPLLTFGRSRRR